MYLCMYVLMYVCMYVCMYECGCMCIWYEPGLGIFAIAFSSIRISATPWQRVTANITNKTKLLLSVMRTISCCCGVAVLRCCDCSFAWYNSRWFPWYDGRWFPLLVVCVWVIWCVLLVECRCDRCKCVWVICCVLLLQCRCRRCNRLTSTLVFLRT